MPFIHNYGTHQQIQPSSSSSGESLTCGFGTLLVFVSPHGVVDVDDERHVVTAGGGVRGDPPLESADLD